MAKLRSKFSSSSERAAGIEAALRKIEASGLKQLFMEQDHTAGYEAEREMEHGNFARSTRFSVEKTRKSDALAGKAPLRRKFIERLGLRMVWTFCGTDFQRTDHPPRCTQASK